MKPNKIIEEFRELLRELSGANLDTLLLTHKKRLEQFLLKALATQRKEIKAKSKENFWEEETRRNYENAVFWRGKYKKSRKEIVREIEEGLPKRRKI